ncbi:reverse transcriptase domain-containing protein [Tanacetum coccineum]
MFPLSLNGEAKTWLNELNKGTIETCDELRTAFISRFFRPALFNRLLGEIRAFLKKTQENESLSNALLKLRMKESTEPVHAYQLLEDKVLLKFDWAKNQKTKTSPKKTIAFADEGSSNTYTDKIMARMDAMTLRMDAQYKELQSRAKQPTPDLDDDHMPMSHKEEAKSCKLFLMIQNKVPPKLKDRGSFLIPCNFNKTFSCNALADLGASINLMPYSLYAKLSLETLKPTKMSVILANRSFQYPVGIAKNMLVEVGKFTFPADFVILEMEEDSKVPLILGRHFLHTADAVI